MTGTNGARIGAGAWLNLLRTCQPPIQSRPTTPMSSHQLRKAIRPSQPTACPTSAAQVTSPNPRLPGRSEDSSHCSSAAATA